VFSVITFSSKDGKKAKKQKKQKKKAHKFSKQNSEKIAETVRLDTLILQSPAQLSIKKATKKKIVFVDDRKQSE
jgi:hypothetical protein